jgi:hypothetical protein
MSVQLWIAAVSVSSSSISAATRIFGIAELVEAILYSGIKMRRLVVLRRVNRIFHDTIANTKALKIKMFLLPESESCGEALVKFNPLLLKRTFGGQGRRQSVGALQTTSFRHFLRTPDHIMVIAAAKLKSLDHFDSFCELLDRITEEPSGLMSETRLLNAPIEVHCHVTFRTSFGLGDWSGYIDVGTNPTLKDLARGIKEKLDAWLRQGVSEWRT